MVQSPPSCAAAGRAAGDLTIRGTLAVKRTALSISCLGLALLLNACAGTSLSEKECLAADWQTIGYQDGANGKPASYIGAHREACAEVGIAPDLQAYRAGREEGLLTYCRPQKGFALGRRGARYNGVCPPHLEGDFVAALNAGRGLREREQELKGIRRDIAKTYGEIDHTKDEIKYHTADLIAGEGDMAYRAELVLKLAELAERQGELERQALDLERLEAARENELYSYRQEIAYRYE